MASPVRIVNSKSTGIRPRLLAALAVGGMAFMPSPSQAVNFKVQAVFQAQALNVPGSVQSQSQFLTSGFYRFDFQITNYNTASVNNNFVTKWGPTPSLPIYDFFAISRCTSQFMCPYQPISSVTTGYWNPSQSVTNFQQFAVEPTDDATFPDNHVKYTMAFGASSGITGLQSNLNGTPENIADIQIGEWLPNMTPLITTNMTVNWNAVGASGANLPSDMTASNIITNLNLTLDTSSPNYVFTDNPATGTSCGATGTNLQCQLVLRFQGENKQIFFNINAMNFYAVPGPMPVIGALAAFGYSRKMRKRLREASNG